MKLSPLIVAIVILTQAPALFAETNRLAVQRKDVFEFTEKPAVARDGDKVTISFAVKDFCDATVAVEEGGNGEAGAGDGTAPMDRPARILRHLASGVLGSNAPEPFQKDSLKQAIVWDGKDDKGEYVKDSSRLTVRVSLGLKARFERTLNWSADRRLSAIKYADSNSMSVAAAPEGVYVYEGDAGGRLLLLDHDGNYVRTLYPFAGGALAEVKGLKWVEFPPDGKLIPVKSDLPQTTWLTCEGPPSRVLAIGPAIGAGPARRIALIGSRINWLATDGTTGGRELTGPDVTFPVAMGTVHTFVGGVYQYGPRSAAFSPDGKWLYMTNFRWGHSWDEGILPGVARLAVDGGQKPEIFLGNMTKKASGKAEGQFDCPSSVDCDGQGRVYVADYLNDRIQVFGADGKFLRSIPATRPAVVRVDRKTGQIFVFSFSLQSSYSNALASTAPAAMTHLGPLDEPRVIASYPLPRIAGLGSVHWAVQRADVDLWADQPAQPGQPAQPRQVRVWLSKSRMQMFETRQRSLALTKDFHDSAARQVVRPLGPRHGRQRLYFNPGNGHLYVGEHQDPAVIHAKGFYRVIEIDPASGRLKEIALPFDCEDMAFDMDGLAYLRTLDLVARYDPATWREVPFDYGEERQAVSYQGFRTARVAGGIVAAAGDNSSSQMGGMSVSPKGRVAVAFYNPGDARDRRSEKGVFNVAIKPYTPRIFPGRATDCLIHVWDKHGKTLYEDAVPGVGRTSSIAMDKDDALYLLANGQTEVGGKPYPNPIVCTLVKVKPKSSVLAVGQMPVPLASDARPKRPGDLLEWFGSGAPAWVDAPEWIYGGVGIDGKLHAKCHCTATSQMAFDYFARSFVSETQRCEIVALDSAGNTILRMGRYGNIDEGAGLVQAGGPLNPRPVGGDELCLADAKFIATDTDRRVFAADIGNYRIVSVRLGYHAQENAPLKDAPAGQP